MPEVTVPQLTWNSALVPLTRQIEKIICHHTDHSTWGVTDTHNYHRNEQGWAGIGYNYFVYFNGEIHECRGRHIGAHTLNWNTRSLGICFQGALDTQQMTDAQVDSGAWLIAKLLHEEHLGLADVVRHKDVAATECPGANFRWEDLRASIQTLLTSEGPDDLTE